jgi:hypothetical protein
MKVVSQPYTFYDGQVLDPEDLNRVWRYKQEALADAAGRRYIESVFPLSFVEDCSTGYTESTASQVRTFSFTAPADLYVTRAFLNGVFSAINAEIKITIVKNSTGTTPAGCTDPWLNVAADATVTQEVRDLNPARFKLESGERYDILLDSSAAFTVTRLDVHFHVLSDRFAFGAEPKFTPLLATEALNGTLAAQNLNDSTYGTQVGNLVELNYEPVCFVMHNQSINSTVASTRKFPVPQIGTTRGKASVYGANLYLHMNGSPPSQDYILELVNNGGSVLDSVTLSLTSPAVTGYVAASGWNVSLEDASSDAASDTSKDRFIQLRTVSGSGTVGKAFITLWIK